MASPLPNFPMGSTHLQESNPEIVAVLNRVAKALEDIVADQGKHFWKNNLGKSGFCDICNKIYNNQYHRT